MKFNTIVLTKDKDYISWYYDTYRLSGPWSAPICIVNLIDNLYVADRGDGGCGWLENRIILKRKEVGWLDDQVKWVLTTDKKEKEDDEEIAVLKSRKYLIDVIKNPQTFGLDKRIWI